MSRAPANFDAGPRLKLVRAPETAGIAPTDELAARAAILEENARASRLTDADARRILAARVAESIDGGRAAILRPERRRRLMKLASTLGLRPFDASLIMAIVQDGARRGEPIDAPLTEARLHTIPHPALAARQRRQAWFFARVVIASLALGVMLLTMLIDWISRG